MREITVNDDRIEAAQKARTGKQPGLKEGGDPRKIGVPDDSELEAQHYLVKQKSFINGVIAEEGTVVRLQPGVKPGKFLEPVRVVKKADMPKHPGPAPEPTKGQKEVVVDGKEPKNPDIDALKDIPEKPIPANSPRGSAANKLKLGGHQSGSDDETGI